MFAWMRPNDLVWNYVVNNYLLGNDPPAHDILFWNNDTTRLPARLHADFLDMYEANPFPRPGALRVRRRKVDAAKIGIGHLRDRRPRGPHHALAGRLPDRAALRRRAQHVRALERGPHPEPRQSGGQLALVVHGGPARAASAESWLGRQKKSEGSWWPHWREWIKRAVGSDERRARSLGSERHPPSPRRLARTCSSAMTAPLQPRAAAGHAHRARRARSPRIRYGIRTGDTARPPLLFLNGLGANIELAQPFIDALPRAGRSSSSTCRE